MALAKTGWTRPSPTPSPPARASAGRCLASGPAPPWLLQRVTGWGTTSSSTVAMPADATYLHAASGKRQPASPPPVNCLASPGPPRPGAFSERQRAYASTPLHRGTPLKPPHLSISGTLCTNNQLTRAADVWPPTAPLSTTQLLSPDCWTSCGRQVQRRPPPH